MSRHGQAIGVSYRGKSAAKKQTQKPLGAHPVLVFCVRWNVVRACVVHTSMNWIKRLFEDADGVPDDARIAAFLIVLTFCCNSIASVTLGNEHAFDASEFGVGAGALAAGIGVWFGQRKDQ